jgi:hypothetical protein
VNRYRSDSAATIDSAAIPQRQRFDSAAIPQRFRSGHVQRFFSDGVAIV